MSLVLQKKIVHFNNPVLTWAMNNAVVTSDPAGNIKLDKSKTTFRIDPVAAFVNAHVRAMVNKNSSSVYETRGVLTV